MPIRNFLTMPAASFVCHDGEGEVDSVTVYGKPDLDSALQFLHYTVVPPGASIGLHRHGNDEELYIVLEGTGVMAVDGTKTPVAKGDAILNKPFGEHALYNTSPTDALKILVLEAQAAKAGAP